MRALRATALLLTFCSAPLLVAQNDIPPPPLDLWPRPVTWTRFSFPEEGFELTLVSDSIQDTTDTWHVGRTRFISTLGVWPQTSTERTLLLSSLVAIPLDSLVRVYWKPRTNRYSIILSSAPPIDGYAALHVTLTNKLNGSQWRALMVKPDDVSLIVLTAQFDKTSEREVGIVDQYFGSLRLHLK